MENGTHFLLVFSIPNFDVRRYAGSYLSWLYALYPMKVTASIDESVEEKFDFQYTLEI